jgi:E3 ubiquitin-protein ligase makorin
MHFAYGEGSCPFGSSCFYLHAYADGTVAEPELRKIGDAEGEVRVYSSAKCVRMRGVGRQHGMG